MSLPNFAIRLDTPTASEIERTQKLYHDTQLILAQERFRHICQYVIGIDSANINKIFANRDNVEDTIARLKEFSDKAAELAIKLFKMQHFI